MLFTGSGGPIKSRLRSILKSSAAEQFMVVVILLSCAIIGLQAQASIDDDLNKVVHVANAFDDILSIVFFLEITLKIYAFGMAI